MASGLCCARRTDTSDIEEPGSARKAHEADESESVDGGSSARFEAILAQCGNAGLWQWRFLILTSFAGMFSAFHNMGSVFLGATPEHWCAPENDDDDGSKAGVSLPSNVSDYSRQCQRPGLAGSYVDCRRWTFDHSQYASTVVTEWSLVCDRRVLYSTVQASFMLGKLVGYPILGALSDRFGRKRVALIGQIVQLVVSCSVSLSQDYVAFIVLRFLVAALTGVTSVAFTLAVEASGPSLRAATGILFVIPYGVGVMILPGIAYFVREWRYLQLALSVPFLFTIVVIFFMPESPRWLAEMGRAAEALRVLKGIAKTNKRTLRSDEEMLKQLESCKVVRHQTKSSVCGAVSTVLPVVLLATGRVMRRRMLASVWVFIVTNAIFYGIQFDSAQLSGSPYVAIFLSGLVEIPAYIVTVPLVDRFGRRPIAVALYLLTGASILLIMAVPADMAWPKLVLAVAGKMFISAAFGLIYLYVIEYTPTTIRNVGLGVTTSSGRIGSASAPYVVDLLTLYHWSLPSCVFGLAAISGALMTLMLPETRGRRLPETIEDVETRAWERLPADARAANNAQIELKPYGTSTTDPSVS